MFVIKNAVIRFVTLTLPVLLMVYMAMRRTMVAAINNTKISCLVALILITLTMIVISGNIHLGLFNMVANLLPIVVTLGCMAFLHIPADMFSMLIGSIAIGIVVDDTIHLLLAYKQHLATSNDPVEAINQTTLISGRAIQIP